MINLLPEDEKNKIYRIKKYKKVFTVMIFAIFSFLVFIFFSYFFRYFLFKQIEKINLSILRKEEAIIRNREIKLHQVAAKINKNLVNIESFWQDQFYYAPIFVKISNILPKGVFVTSIFMQRKEKNKKNAEGKIIGKDIFSDVYIYGWAESRKKLFNFKKNLEKEKWVSNVYFSPSSWVKPKNVDFSLNFEAKK